MAKANEVSKADHDAAEKIVSNNVLASFGPPSISTSRSDAVYEGRNGERSTKVADCTVPVYLAGGFGLSIDVSIYARLSRTAAGESVAFVGSMPKGVGGVTKADYDALLGHVERFASGAWNGWTAAKVAAYNRVTGREVKVSETAAMRPRLVMTKPDDDSKPASEQTSTGKG